MNTNQSYRSYVKRGRLYEYKGNPRRIKWSILTIFAAVAAISFPWVIQMSFSLPVLEIFRGNAGWVYLWCVVLAASFAAFTFGFGFYKIVSKAFYLAALPFVLYYYLWLEGNIAILADVRADFPAHNFTIYSAGFAYLFSLVDLLVNGPLDVVSKKSFPQVILKDGKLSRTSDSNDQG